MFRTIYESMRNVTWKTIIRTILVMGLALLISWGFVGLSNASVDNIIERNERFNNMIKVTDETTLNYCINSQINEFLISGTAKAEQPITLEELKGEYSYIKKTKYHYESHIETYTESYTDSEGKTHTVTKTRTVWDWEYKNSEEWSTNTVTLLGKSFNYNNTSHSTNTIRYEDYGSKSNSFWKDGYYYYTDDDTRYEYSIVPLEYTTTFVSDYNLGMKEGFYSDSIEEVIVPQSTTGIRTFFYILIFISLVTGIVILIFWEKWFPNFLSD